MMTPCAWSRRYAESRALSLGQAVSDLVRRGFSAERPSRVVNGFRVFNLPPDSPIVTAEPIRNLEVECE